MLSSRRIKDKGGVSRVNMNCEGFRINGLQMGAVGWTKQFQKNTSKKTSRRQSTWNATKLIFLLNTILKSYWR
jgi:hypothetical protein